MKRFLRLLALLEGATATIAYGLVAALLIADVLGRQFLGEGISGAPQIAVYAAIVAGFLGFSLATADNEHLRPGFLDGIVPAVAKPFVERLGDFVSACIFFGFAVYGFLFVLETRAVGDRAAVLYFLLWPIQLVIPYALTSASFRHLIFAANPGLKPVTIKEGL